MTDADIDEAGAGERRSERSTRASGGGSRAAQVYDQLREWIRIGRLQPGARVREEDIAHTMQVSRTPVREALSRLQARGLLEMARAGLAVTELTRPQILELYAMREILEGSAARFAAEHAAPSDIATLKYIAARFADCSDAAGYARANTAFHKAIYEAAHNRFQMRMLEELNDSLALLPRTTFELEGRGPAAEIEHGKILAAIERRDPDAAEAAARAHIHEAMQARLTLMFSM